MCPINFRWEETYTPTMHSVSLTLAQNALHSPSLCVIDTLKFRTRFLIMRHTITGTRALAGALRIRIYARVIAGTYVRTYVSTRSRCHIQKVPQLPNWTLLQLTTSTYIGSSAYHVYQRLSFRLSRTLWSLSIVDFVTRLNYASQIRVIVRQEEFLFKRHPSKIIIFRATHN